VGIRFRRSIGIVPGIRLNLGLRSVSISAGVRGLTYTTGTRGQRVTVGLPGTGLSWTSSLPPGTRAKKPIFYSILIIIAIALIWKALGPRISIAPVLPYISPFKVEPAKSKQVHQEGLVGSEINASPAVNFIHPVQTEGAPPPSGHIVPIQVRLIELGYLSGSADGVWGSKSRAALRSFKAASGLDADEIWDEFTNRSIFSKSAIHAPLPLQ
jgi:hypothetical protein